MSGYWRQDAFSSEIRRCHNPDACGGGSNPDTQCAEGHTGAYCDVCESEHYGGRNGQPCEPCEGSPALVYVPLVLVIFVLIILLVWAIRKQGAGAASEALGNAVMAGLEEGISGAGESLEEDAKSLAKDTASGKVKEALFPRIQDGDQTLSVKLQCGSDAAWGMGLIDVEYADDDVDFNRVRDLEPRAAAAGLRLRDKIVSVNGEPAEAPFADLVGDSAEVVLTVARPKQSDASQTRHARVGWIGKRLERAGGRVSGLMVKIKILVALWQVLGALGIIFDIPYPDEYEQALSWLSSIVQVDLPSLMPMQCFHPIDYYDKLMLRTLLPLIVMGILVGGARVAKKRPAWKSLSDKCYIGCFYVLFIIYPSCCAAIFTFLVCDELPDGSRYLRVDYSIDCDASAYKVYGAYAFIMFLVYPIGTPLIFYLFLRREQHLLHRISRHEYAAHAKRKLEKESAAEKQTSGAPVGRPLVQDHDAEWHHEEVARLKPRLSPFVAKLTDGYDMRCYWFEVFECMRKIFLVGIPALFEPGSVEQFMFGMIVCFLSYGMYAFYTPYDDESNDRLQTAAQVEIFVALLAWAGSEMTSESTAMAVALTGLLCVPPIIALLYQTGLNDEVKKLCDCCSKATARLAPQLSKAKLRLRRSSKRELKTQSSAASQSNMVEVVASSSQGSQGEESSTPV